MDKKTFLAELQKNLAVLQEEELRDIINEYEQHIDMKMQSGLSEEEATADFGSLDELTAEILEAYHVRSDYASGSQKNLDASDKPSDHKAAAFFHKIGDGLARVASAKDEAPDTAKDKTYGSARNVNQYTARDEAYGSAKDLNQYTANNEAYGLGRDVTRRSRTGKLKAIWRKLCGGVTSCVHCCLKAALWCVFAIWNVCWAGCALLAALCGLVFLFGLGTLTVLMISGYPLAGITLACLGITLCAFSVSLLGLTLIRHVKKEQA